LVIVGNGMATGRPLDEILRRTPNTFDITGIGGEVHDSYNRIMLSPVLAEESTVEAIVQKIA
jgi:nitrite reductase (NADH) large subunit